VEEGGEKGEEEPFHGEELDFAASLFPHEGVDLGKGKGGRRDRQQKLDYSGGGGHKGWLGAGGRSGKGGGKEGGTRTRSLEAMVRLPIEGKRDGPADFSYRRWQGRREGGKEGRRPLSPQARSRTRNGGQGFRSRGEGGGKEKREKKIMRGVGSENLFGPTRHGCVSRRGHHDP